ncbi:hypothetical protein JCM33374_g2424 [Metschnikowia sp. JCM 33374]|nr:hypothetical protein JCM33374_g2424 [Metschnikowia sp. JCM 33374]
MAMASLCLANLGSLRLVNVSLTCVGVSPYAQAFFSLHYGSDFSGDNSQNGDKRDGSDVLQKHVSKLSSGAVQSPVDVPGPEESERNDTNSDAANNHYTSNDYTSNDYISNDDTSNDDTSNDYTNNENANKENAAAPPTLPNKTSYTSARPSLPDPE